jgi:beta-N-acetylhexosaminidase
VSELERLALRCIWPGFEGLEPPDWLRRRLEAGLGGVVLFGRNCAGVDEVAALSAALRSERPDVVVATDEEGGDVTRLEVATGSSFPGTLALGVVDDLSLTEDVARGIGALCAAAGVNLNFAPVADVNSNPDNPVIGVRSFGSEPELVARHVAAYVRGLQSTGVAACAKHFPGHGDTSEDSHRSLPVSHGELAGALLPFRAAIDAGARSVMTAHIVVPELDDCPATVSRRILTGLLREELGFDGVVVTDALEMQGLAASVGVEEGAVQSIAAGADALCLGSDLRDESVESVCQGLVAAVEDGRLPLERLAEAAARIERLAAWAQPTRVAVDGSAGSDAARRALRIEGDVRLDGPCRVVELLPEPNVAAGPHEHSLAELLGAGADGRLVIVVRDAHRHDWALAETERLVAEHPDAVVVETGIPGRRPSGAAGYVATHGAGRANLEAAAEALRGRR